MYNHDYCQCEKSSSVYSDTDNWGCWDVCSDCGKVIEDSYAYDSEYQSID